MKERYEVHHGLRISDSSLVAAATLSSRYISDRFLPDKAIALVDEAAARLKMEITSKPEELDEIDRKILQLEMEKLSLQKESDLASRERLERLEKELADLKEEQAVLRVQWQSEKDIITKIQSIKEDIDKINLEIQQAQRITNYERASELIYGKLPELQEQLENIETELANTQRTGKSLLREEVTPGDIAEVISKWTILVLNTLLK